MGEHSALDRNDLRSIAAYQKGILYCILGEILLIVLIGVLAWNLPPDINPIVALLFFLIVALLFFLPVSTTATVLVFLLATRVYSVVLGVVLGVLTIVPTVVFIVLLIINKKADAIITITQFVGLIVLLIINGKATAILKKNGFHVGLLGARMSDFK